VSAFAEKLVNIIIQNSISFSANDKKYIGLLSIEALIYRNVGGK
jgi:hypothetical protein